MTQDDGQAPEADAARAEGSAAREGTARKGAASEGTAGEGPARRTIDTQALQGLAHPLRVRILDELIAHGPATSSELARRFGESSGATSYHLRQLARHGFIQELAGRGSSRERWWRSAPEGQRLEGDLMQREGSAATRQAAKLVLDEWHRSRTERLRHWLDTSTTWPREWVEASCDGTAHLRLRRDEAEQLRDELIEVLDRWVEAVRPRRDLPREADTEDVEVHLNLFPLDPPS